MIRHEIGWTRRTTRVAKVLALMVLVLPGGCRRSSVDASGPADSLAYSGLRFVARLGAAGDVDPTSAVFLRDGRLAVADFSTQSILLLDSTGERTRMIGRRGRGPGEFLQLVWVGAASSDTIMAFDFGRMALTAMTSAGGVGATRRLPTLDDGGWPAVQGLLANGLVAVLGNAMPRPPLGDRVPRPGSVVDDSSNLFVVDPANERVVARIGPIPTLRYHVGRTSQGVSAVFPFDPRTTVAVAGELMAVATGLDSTIALHDASGARLRVLHVPLASGQVDKSEIDAQLADEGGSREFRGGRQDILRRLDVPRRAPTITSLLFASPSELLVRGWAPAGATVRWVRLSVVTDTVIGTFTTPVGARILAARGDRLLVQEAGDDARLVLYSLAAVSPVASAPPSRSR